MKLHSIFLNFHSSAYSASKYWINFRRYFNLNQTIMPVSKGCKRDVIFGGRNLIETLLRFNLVILWLPTLSKIRRIFLSGIFKNICLSNSVSHSWNSVPVIHALDLALYLISMFSRLFLKQRGCKNFPITKGISLSVLVAFTHNPIVALSFFIFLSPWYSPRC